MITKEREEGRPGNGTALNDTDTSTIHDEGRYAGTDKWRLGHERRARRAATGTHYFDMCPRGVRERARQIRGAAQAGVA